jgi:hypothetical protein
MNRVFDSLYSKMDVMVAICFIMILTLAVGMMTWSIYTPKGHFKGTQGELSSIYRPYVHQLEKGVERNEKSR